MVIFVVMSFVIFSFFNGNPSVITGKMLSVLGIQIPVDDYHVPSLCLGISQLNYIFYHF